MGFLIRYLRLAVTVNLLLLNYPISAEDPSKDLFFATTVGTGLAWLNHKGAEPGPEVGVIWEVAFGLGVTDSLALGLEFTTWQKTSLGVPYHLHTLAPRLEYSPERRKGVYLTGAMGLGLTDGDPPTKRSGMNLTLAAGYRFSVSSWITLGPEFSAKGHYYFREYELGLKTGERTAFEVSLGLSARFYGSRGVDP